MSLWFRRHWLALVFVLLPGCGYTLTHRLKQAFTYEKGGIFVPVFTNNTDETGAEIVFTDALIRELQSHSETFTNVKEESGIQIYGALSSVTANTESFTSPGFLGLRGPYAGLWGYDHIPDQIGVSVQVSFEVYNTKSGKRVWGKTIPGYRRVGGPLDRVSDQDAPSSVGQTTQSLIESLYSDIARDIMRELYDQMVDI